MSRPDVRGSLITAAEELFAEYGLDAVSLREINAAAGAGNASAIQYHFGNRMGLIKAVLQKHNPAVELHRHALLDQYEAEDTGDLHQLTGALVLPLAAKLEEGAGGAGYLQVQADLVNRPHLVFEAATLNHRDSTNRWRALVEPLLDPDVVRLHRRFISARFTFTELARRSREKPETDNHLYVSHLIDVVTGMLSAPPSPETRRLLARRAGKGQPKQTRKS
jgi:AcrR family transcriptional regulator